MPPEEPQDDTAVDLPAISIADLSDPLLTRSCSLSMRQRKRLLTAHLYKAGAQVTQEVDESAPLQWLPSGPSSWALIEENQGAPSTSSLPQPWILDRSNPITQLQWTQVMGHCPSRFVHREHPVERVTWREAVMFCNRLSITCGLSPVYRLVPDQDQGVIVRTLFGADGLSSRPSPNGGMPPARAKS